MLHISNGLAIDTCSIGDGSAIWKLTMCFELTTYSVTTIFADISEATRVINSSNMDHYEFSSRFHANEMNKLLV